MHIGIDARALMEGKTTGVEAYIIGLLHALFRLDQKNEYILFVNYFKDIKKNLPVFDYPNVHYKISRYPNKLFNIGQIFFNYPKIESLIGPIDLYFSPHWRATALDTGTPLVITFHDLSFEIYPQFFTFRRRLWHYLMNYRGAALSAKLLIAVSNATKTDLQNFYNIPENNIHTIYPGLNELVSSVGHLDKLPEQYFLFFGTFEPRKNLAAVLSAYKVYCAKSEIARPLVIAGSSGWMLQHLRIPTDIKDKIFIYKDVTSGQRYTLYQNAFAFLALSYYEGFGFPLLEAASFGKPVISSHATSLGEIGGDFALFVNPFRPSQVTESMLALEKDSALYESLSKKTRELAGKYSWQETARQTLEVFEQVTK